MKFISTTFLFLAALSTWSNSCLALAPKKIIITFDGTKNAPRLNAPDEGNDRTFTHPLKLHLLAGGDVNNKKNHFPDQVCLYQRGVAGESPRKWIREVRRVVGRLSQQTKPMRKKLEEVYEEGDKIYITGHSRGSASARLFACELNRNGLRKSNGKRIPTPIEFLGCFDTVSMRTVRNLAIIANNIRTGGITKSSVVGEKDGKIPLNVIKAVHHVSLDDNRFKNFPKLYPPVFMDSGDPRVHEVWFPGVHADVGGGVYTKGIPDISCKAMQEWLQNEEVAFIQPEDIDPACVIIDKYPDVKIDASKLTIDPKPAGKTHPNQQQKENPSYRPVVTVTKNKIIEGGTVNVHVGVLQHMEAMEIKGTPYVINPNIKNAKVVIVGSLGKELKAETAKFKEILGL